MSVPKLQGAALVLAGVALALVVLGPLGATSDANAQSRCAGFPSLAGLTPESLDPFTVIVIGTWVVGVDGRGAIDPEAFLKGPAIGTALVLSEPAGNAQSECPPADLASGTRVLAPLRQGPVGALHPDIHTVFVLEDGRAVHPNGGESVGEAELFEAIRGVTNQFAIPAASDSEGASIDWLRVVLPVAGAALGILVAGLLLMGIWHRIDPT